MLKQYKADLHIHTCLSPCAELDMTPASIIETASQKGLDIIAITDHNSAENVQAARKSAAQFNLTVLAGMEVASSEEAHILGIFDDDRILDLQEIVYKNLLPGTNDVSRFGEQVIVNEQDEVLGMNNRMLIAATDLPAQTIIETIHDLGGLAIASHIDRGAFSILSQLGFIPDQMNFDALEMSPNMTREKAESLFKDYSSYTWIASSDAHYPADIAKKISNFSLQAPSITEIRMAMKNKDGRKVEWE